MPELTAATFCRIGSRSISFCAISRSTARRSATHAPEMAAVRVPPSAWMTSQSSVTWRSPSASRSTTARSERPISRWISWVRPVCLPPAASRRPRVWVARGSMPYSAVTQPRPLPRSQEGRLVSTEAVHSTRVSPNPTRQLPSAWRVKPGSMTISRIWSGARPDGRMSTPWKGGALDSGCSAVQLQPSAEEKAMREWMTGLVAMGLSLAGCATAAGADGESSVESVSYETEPCFGACPVYRVMVNRDGSGLFEGRRFTAVTGERRFSVTPTQYRAYVRHLEPLRPASGERRYAGDACEMMATD